VGDFMGFLELKEGDRVEDREKDREMDKIKQ